MKRGGFGPRATPLVAHTGLVAKAGLSRATPMGRGAAPGRNGGPETPQQARRKTQLREWAEVRQAALERDNWTCVGCGRSDLALDVHHRRPKGMGGSKLLDLVENAVSLHGPGNAAGCHGWSHKHAVKASAVGLVVPEGENPAKWPIQYPASLGGGVWLLLPDGDRAPYEGVA